MRMQHLSDTVTDEEYSRFQWAMLLNPGIPRLVQSFRVRVVRGKCGGSTPLGARGRVEVCESSTSTAKMMRRSFS